MTPSEQKPCMYRISAKALILNEAKNAFLITKEENGFWEIPGGGIEHGEDAHDTLKREIKEEMGLETTFVAKNPSYFITDKATLKPHYIALPVYITELSSLDFTPSDECLEIAFVNKANAHEFKLMSSVEKLLEMFEADKR